MIRFNNVTKDFGGETPALNDVSFEIADGEFVFLTGHSGSGKSTLLKIITKEYVPTSGDVEFNNVPLSKIRGNKVHKHRRQIGVVFQDYRLLPELNIWENIALPLEIIGKQNKEIEERVTDLLELVQLTDKAHVFPSQLSGGESQRVGVARALATAPTVLLADEPTGNLDPQNTLLIAKLFNKINELGTTIIFATHDPVILDTLSHRRLNLSKGKLDEDVKATGTKAKTPEKKAKPVEKAAEVKEEVTTSVEQLDATDSTPEPPKAPKAKAKKSFLPKIKIGNPFGKKTAKAATPAKDDKSEEPTAPDIKAPDEEVTVEVETLEENK